MRLRIVECQRKCGLAGNDFMDDFGRVKSIPEQIFVRRLALKRWSAWCNTGHIHNREAEIRGLRRDLVNDFKYVQFCNLYPGELS